METTLKTQLEGVRVIDLTAGIPIRFSELPADYPGPASMLGQHNEEIYLGRLGFSREEMEQLEKEGVI